MRFFLGFVNCWHFVFGAENTHMQLIGVNDMIRNASWAGRGCVRLSFTDLVMYGKIKA